MAGAVRAVAVGAQQPVLLGERERLLGAAGLGERVQRARLGQQALAQGGECRRVLRVEASYAVGPGVQAAQHLLGVPVAQRLGQRTDLRAIAPGGGEPGDRGRRPCGQPPDQVGEHRSGLDRRQLVGVADQHQPRIGAHRLQQPRHHRERDHRGLVDHDDVVGQGVAAVVPEAGRGVRAPAQQTVHRRRGEPLQAPPVLGVETRPGSLLRLADRLQQPGGRLAGRSGQGDPQLAGVGAGRRLRRQHGQQARDGRGLAGAGAAGEDGGPLLRRGERDGALVGRPRAGEEPFGMGGQERRVDLRR